MRERLLAALFARLETGDPESILAEDAQTELDQLMDYLVVPDGLDGQVAYLVGGFHLARGELLGAEAEQELLIAAIVLFPLFLSHPEALPEDVRHGLESMREELVPAGDTPEQAMGRALTEVVWLLLERMVRRGEHDRDGLLAGLATLAVSHLPVGHEARSAALCARGHALAMAAEPAGPHGAEERLDQLVMVFQEAFDGMWAGDRHYARCANALAGALAMKAQQAGDRSLLAEAARLFRIAADPASGGDPVLIQNAEKAARQTEVMAHPTGMLGRGRQLLDQLDDEVRRLGEVRAWVEQERAKRGEIPPEVDRAVTGLGEAMTALDEQGRQLRELHDELERKYRPSAQAGRPALDEGHAVEELLAALREKHGADSVPVEMMATNSEYFRNLRYVAQLANRAIDDVTREFMLGPDSGGTASPLRSLDVPAPPADRADLDEIIALHERVLRELPPGTSEHSRAHLGHLLLTAERLTDPDARAQELPELLPSLMQAVDTALANQFTEAAQMKDHAALGTATSSPFESIAEVDEAITQNRLKLGTLAPDDADRHSVQSSLAYALFARHMLTGDDGAFHEAVSAARQAVTAEAPPDPELVFLWGMVALVRNPAGVPQASASPSVDATATSDLMATLKIADGDAEGALTSWEAGRAHLLASALITRHEIDRLHAAEPGLAGRFVAMRGRLRDVSPYSREVAAVRRREALAREWNTLLGQIRARPGFDRFLLPPRVTFAELAPAAAHGPVIAVNLDRSRCDALVLREGAASVVPLTGLRVDELVEQAGAFREAIRMLSECPDRLLRGTAGRVVVDTLAWLWDVLAEPVLEAAGLAAHPGDGAPWPRVWWAPAGPLNFLPLHAAGRHDTPGASVLDRAVSSYTPTVRALLHSRARPAPVGERTALAVAMPETPGHPALPATTREATAFAAGFTSAGAVPEVLVGPAATREAVRAALPRATFAHFACHASSDPANADASHLLLHDGPLSVTELSRSPLDGAQLAYLSACATARGSSTLADEAVHLASAFQLAGYPRSAPCGRSVTTSQRVRPSRCTTSWLAPPTTPPPTDRRPRTPCTR